jgi:hypothetical protein
MDWYAYAQKDWYYYQDKTRISKYVEFGKITTAQYQEITGEPL